MALDVISDSSVALRNINFRQLENTINVIREARQVFCVGNGGGAAHAMHFAADLRKIAKVRALSFDSIPEMTARINDDGWREAWCDWCRSLDYDDAHDILFMFSVGGGMGDSRTSANLPRAGYGIVGRNGAWGGRIVVPSISTPVIEGCQSVIAHHIVNELA